jgi:hypothetical protein
MEFHNIRKPPLMRQGPLGFMPMSFAIKTIKNYYKDLESET